jgi:hypothetical protein
VYKKLNDARKKFHAKPLKKSGWNDYSKYHYFELGDFLKPALEIFDEVGLCGVITFEKEYAIMMVYDTESSEFIRFTSPMAEANLKGCLPIQSLGAVETYQRRYLWSAALEIVEHDAIDSAKPVEEKDLMLEKYQSVIDTLIVGLDQNDDTLIRSVWEELNNDERQELWGVLAKDTKFGPFKGSRIRSLTKESLQRTENK